LTIPSNQKEVIVALAEAYTEDHTEDYTENYTEAYTEAYISQTPSVVFDDFVEGKGYSLIVLL
jgi:hypothetical protein